MAWLCIWLGISNTRGDLWSNEMGQNNKETDEEHNEDCVEERIVLKVKFDRDGEGDREALHIRNCSINISDGSELELA